MQFSTNRTDLAIGKADYIPKISVEILSSPRAVVSIFSPLSDLYAKHIYCMDD